MTEPPADRDPRLASRWEAAGVWRREAFSHFFDETCNRLGDREALVDEHRRLSFREIRDRSRRLAAGLAGIGIGRGTVVAAQLPNWWETVVLYHAAIRLGAVLNPVLPAYRERELGFILREGGAAALVVPGVFRGFDHREMAERLRQTVPALREIVVAREDPAPGQRSLAALAGDADRPTSPPWGEVARSAGEGETPLSGPRFPGATSFFSCTPREPPPTPRASSTRTARFSTKRGA